MDVSTDKMRVLIFEWLVGGGLLVDAQSLEASSSMFRQGALMRQAIAEDFAAAGCEVVTTTDGRRGETFEFGNAIAIASGEDLPGRLRQLASEVDYLFLIAPESDGRLLRVLDWLEPFADRLLSPGRKWVELFGDKQATCDWLERAGVRVPCGQSWKTGRDVWPPHVALPAVCKPIDGCGGEGIRVAREDWGVESDLGSGQWRIESFVEGESASVAALMGGEKPLLLQPTRQFFDSAGFGVYSGGEMIEDEGIVAAIRRSVEPALGAMSGIRGWVGFDLVVRRETSTEQRQTGGEWLATVVEVNPRLTSSYLGLREYYAANLADCLLRLVRGETTGNSLRRQKKTGMSWRVE